MRIPFDAVISGQKLTDYLLVERPWDDKSKFLEKAGFTLDYPHLLDQAIRELTARIDAVEDGINDYGTFFRVAGDLLGPSGISLPVVLIWLKWNRDNLFHFVTLKPNKGSS